jgi:ERCC4-related helicase
MSYLLAHDIDYRWFPEGKVVFVAPTKPLVAQQIDACHEVCGIPGSDAAELTGQVPRPTRAREVSLSNIYLPSWIVSHNACAVERKKGFLHDSPNVHQRLAH